MRQKFTGFYRFLPLPQNFATPTFYHLPIISDLPRWVADEMRQYALKGLFYLDGWRFLAGFGVLWRVLARQFFVRHAKPPFLCKSA